MDSDLIVMVVSALIALRTLLHVAVVVLSELDARDGKRDWPWVGRLADFCAGIDSVLDLLPVKAPVVRSKR